jgi:hypothetical protein
MTMTGRVDAKYWARTAVDPKWLRTQAQSGRGADVPCRVIDKDAVCGLGLERVENGPKRLFARLGRTQRRAVEHALELLVQAEVLEIHSTALSWHS